jgi:hypothetical protein
VKEETSRKRQKGKTMKLEEVNKRTKEAVDYLLVALGSGHSEALQSTSEVASFALQSLANR